MESLRFARIPIGLAVAVIGTCTAALGTPPTAGADGVAYLVNVTVRPGYGFPNADVALAYGRSICQKVTERQSYRQLIEGVQRDFATTDYYQGAYLINQAVNELCPANISQLRNAAAGFTLRPPVPGR